ncbi:MAG: glycosyltransferase family 9 protein [Nitrospira sp.]
MTSHAAPHIERHGVLVVHPGAIGDVLLARPALSLLRRQFPQHEIALLAGAAVGLILRDSGEIDRVFPLESTCLAELFAGSDSVHLAFKRWLNTCDLAVAWLQDRDGAIADTLRDLGVQRVCVQSPSSPDLLSEHQAARYLEVLEGKIVSKVNCNPLVPSASAREHGRQILQALNRSMQQCLVVIHPGSGSIHKCMEASCFAPVIAWLDREKAFPVLLEGPSDGECVARVRRVLRVSVPVIRDRELSSSAAVLSHADIYLGHDSGMTHLAAALSIPTIACFGPTSPRRWAPLGHRVSILTGEPCRCPDWTSVECCQEKVCLRISPERIIEGCRELLM